MGIRFYCPNGHKLNVKEFLAGQTGVCPRCGATMQIPVESTRPSSKQLQPPPIPSETLRAADPLAEEGKVVWYVRPASGGQLGPAAADLMRGWLAEGRVTADSLVWREGWRDWRPAGGVFSQLSPGDVIPGLESIAPEPIVAPIYSHHASHPTPPRRTQLIVIGALVLVLLVLSIIYLLIPSRP